MKSSSRRIRRTGNKLKEANEELREKISEIQKETLLETGELDSEIWKIENDLEGARQKLKENNPKVEEIQCFFSEAKDFIASYKEELSKKESAKKLRVKMFDLQRKLNDKDFDNSQKDLKIKKDLNDELRQLKAKEEEEKNKLDDSIVEGAVPNIEELQKEIEDLQSKNERLLKRKAEKQVEVDEKSVTLDELRSKIETTKITERDLETKIYKLSGENMLKINEKDSLIMLLPDIILALRHEPNELKAWLNSIPNQETVHRVKQMLKQLFGSK